MNEVNAVQGLATTATLREFANQSPRQNARADKPTPNDSVEISELATFLNRLAELPEERARKIVEVRNAINDGSYETPDKLEVAIDRMLNDLAVQ